MAAILRGRDGRTVTRFQSKLASDSAEFTAAVEAALKG